MPDPQKELFKMLADSNLRMRSIRSLHKSRSATIPNRQTAMLQQVQQLRQRIQAAGVGGNPQAENQYLELLEDLRYLDQSFEMSAMTFPDTQRSVAEQVPPELQKSLNYGRLLLSVYAVGALVKGAGSDLRAWGERLTAQDHPECKRVGGLLLSLLEH